jgi:hypothetical protein
MPQFQQPPNHEPTPEQIRERCLAIQMTWTREVEKSRRVIKDAPRCEIETKPWPIETCGKFVETRYW